MENVEKLLTEGLNEIEMTATVQDLDVIKSRFLGKSGIFTDLLKQLANFTLEERKIIGAEINQAKEKFVSVLNQRRIYMNKAILENQLAKESLDVTLPGRGNLPKGLHPITLTQQRIVKLFSTLGFLVVDGPEIETDFYNFQALNIPENHPARAMQDTFYVEGGNVLRTHTSSVQARYMMQHEPPIKIIAPGRVYRVDSDATHSPMFHQMEGLWVEEGVSFADLKATVTDFLKYFFEQQDLQVRFRPSFFPFTAPSAEIDVFGEKRWLEVGGCGMVHPNVLRNVNIDSEKYTGWALGIGIDRFAMLRYGINDLRLFFDNDLNFLQQFH